MARITERTSLLVRGILILAILFPVFTFQFESSFTTSDEGFILSPLCSNKYNSSPTVELDIIKNSIDSDWLLGETVKTTISAGTVGTNYYFSLEKDPQSMGWTHSSRTYDGTETTIFGSYQDLNEFDYQNYSIRLNRTSDNEWYPHLNLSYILEYNVKPIYQSFTVIFNTSMTHYGDSAYSYGDWINQSFSFVPTNYRSIDNNLRLRVVHFFEQSVEGDEGIGVKDINHSVIVDGYNYYTGIYDNLFTLSETDEDWEDDWGIVPNNFDFLQIDIEAFILMGEVEEILHGYYRSEYKTRTDNVLHKITIENFIANVYIYIYAPLSWNFSSINPTAVVSWDSTNKYWLISNVYAITYNVFFSSGVGCGQDTLTQKQYLSISEFNDPSTDFEGDFNPWVEDTSSGEFDDALNSTIVFDGAFSLRWSDTAGGSSTDGIIKILESDLSAGYYYLSFSYYLEDTFDLFRIYWKENGATYEAIDQSQTNRWITYFNYFHLTETTAANYQMRIWTQNYAGHTGVLFIDNLQFWRVNHVVETESWRKIKDSGYLRNPDGYDNPVVPYEEVTIAHFDRTAGTNITVATVTTDVNGYWEKEIDVSSYSALQDQRENGVNCTATNAASSVSNTSTSYFTPVKATDFRYFHETSSQDNEWDYSEGTTESFSTNSPGATMTASTGYIQLIQDGTRTYASAIVSSQSIDASEYTQAIIRVYTNVSLSYLQIKDGSGNQIGIANPTGTGWLSIQTFDIGSDGDWSGTETGIQVVADIGANDPFTIRYDEIRLVHRDTPTISTADSYAWCSSQNNSFTYRTEIDSTVQGYYSDLTYFSTDQTLGSHTINTTVYDDTSRSGIVFLPGTSVTSSYTISTDFYVSVENIYLSDDYVNVFVTASKDGTYIIYENDSSVGSGSFDKDGTAISSSRNTTYGSLIALAYKFTNSTDNIWFNTSYSVADYTHLIVTISTPILVDGRISIGVTSNLGDSQVNIEDDSIVGTEVDWENEGVFSWFSNTVGENNLTIQVRNDANGDGDYTDSGETWSDAVSYHLYELDLEIVYAFLSPYADEGATFSFMSNHRGSGTTEFRCKTQDELGWSGWLSEDNYNGTYDFTFVNCDMDTTYNFSVEIRNYITDESPGYQYKYLRIEYTPYNPDAVVSNPQGINIPTTVTVLVTEDQDIIKASFSLPQIVLLIVLISTVIGIAVVVYKNRDKIPTTPKFPE